MVEFKYAQGRIPESIQFISEEIREFEQDYLDRTWREYQEDKKLQKLIDRTVENILIPIRNQVIARSVATWQSKLLRLLRFARNDRT